MEREERDIRDIIVHARKGDGMAFEELVHRHDKQVLAIALSYCGNSEEAKDIYQEVFLKVHKALPRFEFRSSFSTWLHRITVNTCLTHRARNRKRTEVSLDQGFGSDPANPALRQDRLAEEPLAEREAFGSEIAELIQEAMDQLSPQQRMVFTLRHYQGFKLREIASILECAEGTVKKYLFVATERMREQLRPVVK